MSYIKLPERTSYDLISAADINQLQNNFDAVIGGDQPLGTINDHEERLQTVESGIASIESSFMNIKVLTSDIINNNATANTLQDIPDFSIDMTSGKTYYFRAVIVYTAAADTTGSRWTIYASSGTPYFTSIQTATSSTVSICTNNVFGYPSGANASSLAAGSMCTIDGFVVADADTTLYFRFASEVSDSAITAKAGSVLFWKEI